MAELFDIVVRRQIYVEGLKAAKQAEFAALLATLSTKLRERLSTFEYPELGDATKTALRKLIVDLQLIAKRVFDPYLSNLIDWLRRFVHVDDDLLFNVYADAMPGKSADKPDSDRLWAVATNAPMPATGTLPLPFLTALLPSLYVKLQRLTFQNYAMQGSRDDLIKAIVGSNSNMSDGALRLLNVQGSAVVNTVLQHLANQNGAALGKLFFGYYEWVSVLDNRTTLYCLQHDGKRYAWGKGPLPPAHPNCRSTIVPIPALNAPKTPENFSVWIGGQPDAFVADALDGKRGDIYERASPISLAEYAGKGELITA